MRPSRKTLKFTLAIFLFFSAVIRDGFAKDSKAAQAAAAKKTKNQSLKFLCEPEVVGLAMTSLLRLARADTINLRWNRSATYRMNAQNDDIDVKYKGGAEPEKWGVENAKQGADNFYFYRSLNIEKKFMKNIGLKKLPKGMAEKFSFLEKLEFEVNAADSTDAAATTDEFKWSFEHDGILYSYGLRAPVTTNSDEAIVYLPLVPHCSEDKVDEFKKKYEPLQFLWTMAGVLTGDQEKVLFKILYDLSPESDK